MVKKKVKVGDIVEIPTGKGLCYALYTHRHPRYGALLRVLEGFYGERPKEIESLPAHFAVAFSTFFPLQAAVDQGIFEIVGNAKVPPEQQEFPTFRAGVVDPKTKKVVSWWLWDGEEEWQIGELNAEQRRFPIRGVWNDTLLIERIEAGWRPETDPS